MPRYSTPRLTRLTYRLWIRLALNDYIAAVGRGEVEASKAVPHGKEVWPWFARELWGPFDADSAQEESALRSLLGVVKDGNDPRQLKRYIPVADNSAADDDKGYRTVSRRPAGPSPRGDDSARKPSPFYEVQLDLIELIESRLAGSSAWASAFLWELIAQEPLPLETIRWKITALLHVLKLVRPSKSERRHWLPQEAYDAFRRADFSEQKRRYAASLLPLTQRACAHSVSLLAALCAESYLADNDTLFDLHRDAAHSAFVNLLASDIMEDIRDDFQELVGLKILTGYGSGSNLPEPSSLSAPLMCLEEWEDQTGSAWTPIIVI